MRVYVSVCVCERERERERECMCVWERECVCNHMYNGCDCVFANMCKSVLTMFVCVQ